MDEETDAVDLVVSEPVRVDEGLQRRDQVTEEEPKTAITELSGIDSLPPEHPIIGATRRILAGIAVIFSGGTTTEGEAEARIFKEQIASIVSLLKPEKDADTVKFLFEAVDRRFVERADIAALIKEAIHATLNG